MDVIIRFSRKYINGATYRGRKWERGRRVERPFRVAESKDGKMNILNEII